MTSITLTDDELAALCFATNTPWPVPFPTIELAVDDLINSARRGRRALIVREIVDGDDAPAVRLVAAATASTAHLFGYVSTSDAPSILAGSSTVAFLAPDGAVLDMVSASGVHELRSMASAKAIGSVLAIAKAAFDHGFQRETGDERLILGTGSGPSAVRIHRGRVETGTIDDGAFNLGTTSVEWSEGELRAVLGLAPA